MPLQITRQDITKHIRNHYVNSSKFHAYLMADDVSSRVYKYLLAIACKDLDISFN